MSTRSAIIEKTENGYRGVYCHFDGYVHKDTPDCVANVLNDHYKDAEKVSELIDLGSLSCLRCYVDQGECHGHSFDTPFEDVTVAYHRDRGEDLDIRYGDTIKEVESQIGHNGYVYVFENNKWTVNGKSLKKALGY
jgi:hypothetical protein